MHVTYVLQLETKVYLTSLHDGGVCTKHASGINIPMESARVKVSDLSQLMGGPFNYWP